MMNLQKYQPMRMIDFIALLYRKYPVLNKLTEQESNKFETEVISLLIDENQNLQKQAYEDVMRKIGLSNFVLQILSKTINRNKFKNQFQMNRNITQIADKLEKQKGELQKRQKLIQRKQQRLNKQQNQLTERIKCFGIKIEKEIIQKLTEKQLQIKKSINNQLHKVKGKQKLLSEKVQQIKKSIKKNQEVISKQKQFQQRVRQLDKKQKQWKIKELQISNSHDKQDQINNLMKQNESLKKQIKQVNSKLKNCDMAYRKVKNQISVKQNICEQLSRQKDQLFKQFDIMKVEFNKKQIEYRQSQKQKAKLRPTIQQAFDAMNISNIDSSEFKQENKNLFEDINSANQQITTGNQGLLSIVSKIQLDNYQQDYQKTISHRKQNKNFTNIMNIMNDNPEQKSSKGSLEEQIGINLQIYSQEQSFSSPIIQQLKSLRISSDQQKLQLIQRQIIAQWIQTCSGQMHYQKETCLELINVFLQLLQDSKYYATIIDYLSRQSITSFLQDVYLRYQTHQEISLIVTLILSRLQLSKCTIKIHDAFIKSLRIRLRLNQANPDMFYSNIRFIIQKNKY